jgi:gas vesicle protein
MKKENINMILTFAVGAGAGLLAGLLTAPRSGKESRKMISDEIDNTKTALEDAANQKLEEAKSYLNNTIETQMDNGKKAIENIKEKVTVS